MRAVPVILLSLALLSNSLAQNQWQDVRGVADVYPTERMAVDAITREFVNDLRHRPSFSPNDWHIVVRQMSEDESKLPPLPDGNRNSAGSGSMGGRSFEMSNDITQSAARSAVASAIASLQKLFPYATIDRDLPAEPGSKVAVLSIGVGELEQIDTSSPIVDGGSVGKMKAKFTIDNRIRESATRFTGQSWADDFATFIDRQPVNTWVVGKSNEVAQSRDLAFKSACDDAATQFAQKRMNLGVQLPYPTPDPLGMLTSMAATHFRQGHVTDRFVQRIDTTSGACWQAAVLVSTDENALQQILPAQRSQSVSVTSSRSWIWKIKSIFVMVSVIVVLTVVLKLITGSAFNRRWLTVGVLVVVATIIFLMFVAVPRVQSVPAARVEIVR